MCERATFIIYVFCANGFVKKLLVDSVVWSTFLYPYHIRDKGL